MNKYIFKIVLIALLCITVCIHAVDLRVCSGTVNVAIKSFKYSPNPITIRTGTTVTWTNQDSTSHTVTSDSGKFLASKTLTKGKKFSKVCNNNTKQECLLTQVLLF
jgi:plastocyanin